MGPLVSGIVPAFNAERFLSDALDSALAQTLRDSEIIVVDDGSTDATGAIADRYAAAHPQRVRVIHQANGGLVAARNAAIAVARGRYIALLDADDFWLPHHLEISTRELESAAEVGLVHSNIEFMDIEGRVLNVPVRAQPSSKGAFLDILLRRTNVACPTTVFRHSLINDIGAFDPTFNRLGCEDRDMWLRIAKVAAHCYLDSVHARYRIVANSLSRNLSSMHRARLLLIAKHAHDAPGSLWRRQAVAATYKMAGDELFEGRMRRRALSAYLQALVRDPLSEAGWRGAARCLLRPWPGPGRGPLGESH